MKILSKSSGRWIVGMGCCAALVGCQPKGNSPDEPKQTAEQNTNMSSSVAATVANTASNAYNSASNAYSSAVDSTRTLVAGSTNVNDSGINTRDRNGATLTPGDQGNSATDVTMTQQIRKALVMGTNDLSVVAQNVKIITVNGKVTLRGPVNTEAEKNEVVSTARTIAGGDNVNDQLQVKTVQ
jgi:hyperosmotically inducible protein